MTDPVEPRRPVSAELVDRIAHDIREGALRPREHLVETEIAERYGSTRNAARSALIELTALGLVERTANRGARVRQISIDEAIESTEVRLTLQAMCAELAADRITRDERERLRAALDDLRTAVEEGDMAANTRANADISRMIRDISGHRTAAQIIESLQARVQLNTYPYLLPDRRVASMHEYEQIVQAVLNGDRAAAVAAVRRHRDAVLDALREIRVAMRADPA